MIEAYKIGVELALTGNIASAVAQLAKDFDAVNRIVQQAQVGAKELSASLANLERVGSSAASAWGRAASAMERATRAASGGVTQRMPAAPYVPPAPQPPPVQPYPTSSARRQAGSQPLRLTYDDNANRVSSPPDYHPIFGQQNGFTMGPDEPSTRARPVGSPYIPNGQVVPIGPGQDLIRPGGSLVPGGPGGPGGPGAPPPYVPLFPNGYPQPGAPPQRPGASDYLMAGAGLGIAAKGGEDLLSAMLRAQMEQAVTKSALQLQGFTPEQLDRADQEAGRLQREVPSITVGGGLKLIKDVMTITQNPEEALSHDALKALAGTAVVLQRFGKGDEMGELYKALQAGELRGALTNQATGQIDNGTLEKFLLQIQQATVISGGRVGPAEILQVLKSAGVAGRTIDASVLTGDLLAVLTSIGAARAGTGLKAAFGQFAGGKMSEGAAVTLAEAHMFNLPADAPLGDEQALKRYLRAHYKAGPGMFQLPPGVFPDADQVATNPIAFVKDRLIPAADKYNADHHIVSHNGDELLIHRQEAITRMIAREPALSVFGDIMSNLLLIERDMQASRDATARFSEQGKSPLETVIATDPRIQIDAAQAALNAWLATMGGTVMKDALVVLGQFTQSLNAVTDWAKANPTASASLVRFAEALTIATGAIAAAAGTIAVLAPTLTILRSIGGGAGAAGAAGAAGTGGAFTFGVGGSGMLGPVALGGGAGLAGLYLLNQALGGEEGIRRSEALLDRLARESRAPQGMGNTTTDGFDVEGRPINAVPPAAPPPAQDPNAVQRVFITNPRDLATGVASGMARQSALPFSGTTFADPRQTPDLGLLGIP